MRAVRKLTLLCGSCPRIYVTVWKLSQNLRYCVEILKDICTFPGAVQICTLLSGNCPKTYVTVWKLSRNLRYCVEILHDIIEKTVKFYKFIGFYAFLSVFLYFF